jgi:hypothetical protein
VAHAQFNSPRALWRFRRRSFAKKAGVAAIARFGQPLMLLYLDKVTAYFENGKVKLSSKYHSHLLPSTDMVKSGKEYRTQA